MTSRAPGLLLVANYDSAVGYAWWLMESYWAALARRYETTRTVFLSYPSISKLPEEISGAPAHVVVASFERKDAKAVWGQLKFLRAHRIRTIYFSDQELLHWRYMLYRIAGVRKIIVHDHTPGRRSVTAGWKRLLKRIAHSLPWASADGVFGATQFVTHRHITVDCAPARKCFVVANGIRQRVEERWSEDVHDRFGIDRNRRVLVATGRAHKVKGVPFALQCVSELIHGRSRSDVHFLYCGDGPHLEDFVAQARELRVESNVTFAGHQNVSSFLSSCDIAFHPSEAEVGYSLSILEYMQAGLPVVVPDNPSVCGATVGGTTGLIYATGNVSAAANAIEQLLDDSSESRAMGKAGRELVLARYSLPAAHEALLAAFQAIDPDTGS